MPPQSGHGTYLDSVWTRATKTVSPMLNFVVIVLNSILHTIHRPILHRKPAPLILIHPLRKEIKRADVVACKADVELAFSVGHVLDLGAHVIGLSLLI